MRFKLQPMALGATAVVALCACMAAGTNPAVTRDEAAAASNETAATEKSYAGWYMEHAGQGMFQPCGQDQPWRVSVPADLPARAKVFALDEDTPVYVRVLGAVEGEAIAVSRVEQFGSPVPVRNCAMTGVVIPSGVDQ